MRRLNSRYIIGPMTDTPVLADTASFKHAVDPARIVALLANELNVRATQVAATVELLDGGATVPFIARYRKEATGGLDDTLLRHLEVRLLYVRELESRRAAILESVHQQGKLTHYLQQEIRYRKRVVAGQRGSVRVELG